MRSTLLICLLLDSLRTAVAQASKYSPSRLVVAEEVQKLGMRHNISFKRSPTFAIYKDLLFVPAADQPKIGLWKMGKFRATYEGGSKTSCKFSKQANYYLPGNNRVEFTGVTVDQCKQKCCDDELCQSFDYGKSGADANKCWLSAFKESASGLTFDGTSSYDYYEVVPTEVISELTVINATSTLTLVVGSAKYSGNLYQYKLSTTAPYSLAPLGYYVKTTAGSEGHTKAILALERLHGAAWTSEYLMTGGYDKQVIVWSIKNNLLHAKLRITNFSWPIWAITSGPKKNQVFVAGDHASISRWTIGNITKDLVAPRDWNQTLKGHSRLVRCMAFDHHNEIMASGSEDTRIILWHKKKDGSDNYEFGAKLYDHKDAVKTVAFATPGIEPLLISSGDDGSVNIFDPQAEETTCNFEKQTNYYLPGNNRYEFSDSSLAECMKICCESDWCASFDYATKADPGGFHGANTCWLSTNVEGPSGIQWDGTGTYNYYEISKRGTKLVSVPQPGPVNMIGYAASPVNLLLIDHNGDASNDGGLFFIKMTEVTCPDGSSPNFEGTECMDCRLGFAGKGGKCLECGPGKYAPKEGSFQCEPCPMGWASSITETPALHLVEDLWGLTKCTECPKWALKTKTGQYFCEWCPPGSFPDADRRSCLTLGSGADYNSGRGDWTESWGRDGQERSDAFCPVGKQSWDSCMYPPKQLTYARCPMTCPRNYQVEVDKNWNPKGLRSLNLLKGITTDFDVSWHCLLQNKTAQRLCNKLLCMGAIVSMQGDHEKERCEKDRTDCTCAEDLRESCKGGLKRLREEQCQQQCTARWCDLMCQQARAREYTGIFRPDNVENPFTVLRCEAKGTQCVATCRNTQRRVTAVRNCGEFDIWDDSKAKYLITNDALCGQEGVFEQVTRHRYRDNGHSERYTEEVYRGTRESANVCTYGTMEKMRRPTSTGFHRTYRPDACVGVGAARVFAMPSALVFLASMLSIMLSF